MRIGAFDLLAPPAGNYSMMVFNIRIFSVQFSLFRIGILGFLTYKRAMSELSFQEVYITDPLHFYTVYIHTVCVYTRVFFAIFYDFYGFLRFLWIFWVFYWIFYFSI